MPREGRTTFQLRLVRMFETVLVLRAADPIFYGEVLHGLHVERDPGDCGRPFLQSPDDGLDIVPLFDRFERDLQTAAVGCDVGTVDADER